jgi:hypothetical protein
VADGNARTDDTAVNVDIACGVVVARHGCFR